MLKTLLAGTLERMLEAEMEQHLGYSKNSVKGNNSGSSRNDYGKKTIKSEWGESEISVPRDRNGVFEPKVVEKRQTRTDEIERRILAAYAKGMSVRDIEDQLRDIYGAEVSPALISNITINWKLIEVAYEWGKRLDAKERLVEALSPTHDNGYRDSLKPLAKDLVNFCLSHPDDLPKAVGMLTDEEVAILACCYTWSRHPRELRHYGKQLISIAQIRECCLVDTDFTASNNKPSDEMKEEE